MFAAVHGRSNLRTRAVRCGGPGIRQQSAVALATLQQRDQARASPKKKNISTTTAAARSSSAAELFRRRRSRNDQLSPSRKVDSFWIRSLTTPPSPSTDASRSAADEHPPPPPISSEARVEFINNDKKPNLEEASGMPLTFQGMDNSTLVVLGRLGDHQAHAEILKRHIMTVDKVDYDRACQKFAEIEEKNREGKYLLTLPYRIGIMAALSAGFLSIPLVFHLETAEWFNEYFVTTDIPESEDLETWLEVGAWTWNWMEPPLGQISFLLLCLQFSRSQMNNLGMKPYTKSIKRWRGQHLASLFPQYSEKVIVDFSESSQMIE